ncbi:3-deoxy-manno-octulosonate cytidylyltransferase [Paenibacillus rubinfantis]|uniref:3-deoxy-manno-octulosonate cytidylyltransferase n=1 Tax=Paenibacillus rubinfantis TaxID=1720296 RepID=UPI00073EDE39|nr:3-deoxy-manno-octulosonate cytidylyltransferase [Paenibacillus rubinfantis]
MKIIGVIPARYKSSRFEGKPLADICGKPMVWWVYEQALKVKELTEVYVATDDSRIYNKCVELNINVIMTSESHPTGTDRVGEVARKIPADVYINIQGDEPLIKPDTISDAISPFFKNIEDIYVTNMMTKIKRDYEIIDNTVPKVVVNSTGKGIYLSRLPIPYPKGDVTNYYKQVCVYGFTPKALEFYCDTPRGVVEKAEDIEILRFIENGHSVQFIETLHDTVAVDTKTDLERVRELIGSKHI